MEGAAGAGSIWAGLIHSGIPLGGYLIPVHQAGDAWVVLCADATVMWFGARQLIPLLDEPGRGVFPYLHLLDIVVLDWVRTHPLDYLLPIPAL